MTEKQLVEGLSFEEYLRNVCMPTQRIDTTNHKIVKIIDCECSELEK